MYKNQAQEQPVAIVTEASEAAFIKVHCCASNNSTIYAQSVHLCENRLMHKFDAIFHKDGQDEDVYRTAIKDIVEQWCIEGPESNATILVYGPAERTFSMEMLNRDSKEEEEELRESTADNSLDIPLLDNQKFELLPRILEQIMRSAADQQQQENVAAAQESTSAAARPAAKAAAAPLTLSYFELTEDRVVDLFAAPENSKMQLRENGDQQFEIEGLTRRHFASLEEAAKMVEGANKGRTPSAHLFWQIEREGYSGKLVLADLMHPSEHLDKMVAILAGDNDDQNDLLQCKNSAVVRILRPAFCCSASNPTALILCLPPYISPEELLLFGERARLVNAAAWHKIMRQDQHQSTSVQQIKRAKIESAAFADEGSTQQKQRTPPRRTDFVVAGQSPVPVRCQGKWMSQKDVAARIINTHRVFRVPDSQWAIVRKLDQQNAIATSAEAFFLHMPTSIPEIGRIPEAMREGRKDVHLLFQHPTLMKYRDELLRTLLRVLSGQTSVDQLLAETHPQEQAVHRFFGTRAGGDKQRQPRNKCTYLLLDTRFFGEPEQPWTASFAEFVASIFYIGQGGEQNPPHMHFIEAKLHKGITQQMKIEDLIEENVDAGTEASFWRKQLFCRIWSDGCGVVKLVPATHIGEEEARLSEACMIRARSIGGWHDENQHCINRRLDIAGPAYGCHDLTNEQEECWRRTPLTDHWAPSEAESYGVRLLLRAYRVLTTVRTLPLHEHDIDVGIKWPSYSRGNSSPSSNGTNSSGKKKLAPQRSNESALMEEYMEEYFNYDRSPSQSENASTSDY